MQIKIKLLCEIFTVNAEGELNVTVNFSGCDQTRNTAQFSASHT